MDKEQAKQKKQELIEQYNTAQSQATELGAIQQRALGQLQLLNEIIGDEEDIEEQEVA